MISVERDVKYRWLFHGLVMVLAFIPPLIFINSIGVALGQSTRVFLLAIVAIPFYLINIVWLVPSYLKQQQYRKYTLGLITIVAVHYLSLRLFSPMGTHLVVITSPTAAPVEIPIKAFPPVMSFFLLTLVLGTTFDMLLDWERRGRVIERTQKEKLAAELSFLKTQINPHFLFNTLNSIYALAATNTEVTQRAVLLLSDLMRYILYESDVDKIMLSKEVQFLQNYIDLQKLRYSPSSGKDVKFEQCGDIATFQIEPLLLITFVENAFKHSHSYQRKSKIHVGVEAQGHHELRFRVSNTIGDYAEQIEQESGIGLENVKRRLALLYPGRHQLSIDKTQSCFDVVLTLTR